MGAAGSDVGAQDTARRDTVEMLVAFVEQSDGPSAAQIVDIAQVPHHLFTHCSAYDICILDGMFEALAMREALCTRWSIYPSDNALMMIL